MKAIVTGAAGHIGSTIVDDLIEMGVDVIGVDDLSAGNPANINPKCQFHELSILDTDALMRVSEGVELFYHCAVLLPHVRPPYEDVAYHEKVNVLGTLNCMEAARASGRLKKFVFASTCAVYGNAQQFPTTEAAPLELQTRPYTIHKFACEQHLLLHNKRFDFPCVILRYFATYGKRSFNPIKPSNAYISAVVVFVRQYKQGKALTVTGDGTQSRDLIHVDDVSRISIAASLSDKSGEIYNVCSGQSYRIIDVAKKISDNIVFCDRHMGEVEKVHGSNAKLKAELGLTPQITLDDGIGRLMEEVRI